MALTYNQQRNLKATTIGAAGIGKAISLLGEGFAAQAAGYSQAGQYAFQAKSAENNAFLLNAETSNLEAQLSLDEMRYNRQKSSIASTIMARTAFAGLKLSGSPAAVLSDNFEQIELDRSINRYNVELEKWNIKAKQQQYNQIASFSKGQAEAAVKTAKKQSVVSMLGAASSLMSTAGSISSLYK